MFILIYIFSTADSITNFQFFILTSGNAFLQNKVYSLWPLEIENLQLRTQSFS